MHPPSSLRLSACEASSLSECIFGAAFWACVRHSIATLAERRMLGLYSKASQGFVLPLALLVATSCS